MNTQNVNVKTAAQEPSERYGEKASVLRTDGFVRNLHSSHPFDVIRADVVLAQMEAQAHRGCGLHYEIYHSYLLDAALDYLAGLPLKDRLPFIGAAARRGIMLTFAEGDRAGDACHALMANLAADY
jgi:hypothetical protein|uniref:hypothetical protein n=1 Tax=Serratia proteamaculans TaxID=28151 RepID=UPI001F4C0B76|nr:hypothetical protein [Serratia proteamaculans]ULG15806.1 hypothetical protein 495p2_00054 [Serratia proteamaculans]